MNSLTPETLPGYARRHDDWNEVTAISSMARRTMSPVSNYVLVRAATRADATAGARLLLVHLIGYLGQDDAERPESRFVVFPGNQRLSDELRCTPRSVQRQADELEEKGLLRRCYNGMNRRTGFDLTPFAVQHADIVAGIIAIQTQRRQSREDAQLELSLAADRIVRPDRFATSASPRDDADVTHNRPEDPSDEVGADAGAALDAVDRVRLAGFLAPDSVGVDRTEFGDDQTLALITRRFTGGGRASHLGWDAALRSLGRDRAVALYLVAERDPRRRATTERYFGWLLRMHADGAGEVVVDAAARAMEAGSPAAKARARRAGDDVERPAPRARKAPRVKVPARTVTSPPPAGQPSLPTVDDVRTDAVRDPFRTAAAAVLGERLYRSWIEPAAIRTEGSVVTLSVGTAFTAGWIRNHLTEPLSQAARGSMGPDASVRVECAATQGGRSAGGRM